MGKGKIYYMYIHVHTRLWMYMYVRIRKSYSLILDPPSRSINSHMTFDPQEYNVQKEGEPVNKAT